MRKAKEAFENAEDKLRRRREHFPKHPSEIPEARRRKYDYDQELFTYGNQIGDLLDRIPVLRQKYEDLLPLEAPAAAQVQKEIERCTADIQSIRDRIAAIALIAPERTIAPTRQEDIRPPRLEEATTKQKDISKKGPTTSRIFRPLVFVPREDLLHAIRPQQTGNLSPLAKLDSFQASAPVLKTHAPNPDELAIAKNIVRHERLNDPILYFRLMAACREAFGEAKTRFPKLTQPLHSPLEEQFHHHFLTDATWIDSHGEQTLTQKAMPLSTHLDFARLVLTFPPGASLDKNFISGFQSMDLINRMQIDWLKMRLKGETTPPIHPSIAQSLTPAQYELYSRAMTVIGGQYIAPPDLPDDMPDTEPEKVLPLLEEFIATVDLFLSKTNDLKQFALRKLNSIILPDNPLEDEALMDVWEAFAQEKTFFDQFLSKYKTKTAPQFASYVYFCLRGMTSKILPATNITRLGTHVGMLYFSRKLADRMKELQKA